MASKFTIKVYIPPAHSFLSSFMAFPPCPSIADYLRSRNITTQFIRFRDISLSIRFCHKDTKGKRHEQSARQQFHFSFHKVIS